ncbi:hypothetical protein PHYBLDRAFT_70129 [Phycomyces blakesleeanus NRRL 1555(-)]|uniref:Shugoshin C-terminal domain-containing protein n=1 Tax=Phycomyces blakesleeanus (strain ATCC 8743b / DSM 1359 / FGSC 10004 / NBRC 33097 / NRRL 1555) TaxID=763407 RepID=A0A162TG73_PHYB8|nr:hypothetical protein PHYBLDRAFT_70129 [Phycomyces blakesleeanus NRRL 1555(-)]OAD66883.1 hypothetical protein PHYBLDRAFT_70129 [Phycomyces blakesleeanus NRRL 1555(-)]|eukprot:XP_018284923.1 hypothetical protein PHYBLDRAFT_70129 [Phycomyces blakesleeanus NRRL 1555(-)]
MSIDINCVEVDKARKELDAFKQRHHQQNHELVQFNIAYALKIQTLSKELRDLRHENISLRISLIHLKQNTPTPTPTPTETTTTKDSLKRELIRPSNCQCQCQCKQKKHDTQNIDTQVPICDSPTQEDQHQKVDEPTEFFADSPGTLDICTQEIGRSKRSTLRKCYTMPSVKSKLRKGDPFTFGNKLQTNK